MLDRNGKPFKVIKFATEITAQKIASMEDAGKIAAIRRAQAVIEFEMDGTIVDRQREFPEEPSAIRSRKSRASITACSSSRRCATAPGTVNSGRASIAANIQAAEYKRIGKGGKEVWILASYNPILDENGKPFKIVEIRNRCHRAEASASPTSLARSPRSANPRR